MPTKMKDGTYVDDSFAGGSEDEVSEMIGSVTKSDVKKFQYDGVVSQICSIGGFKI